MGFGVGKADVSDRLQARLGIVGDKGVKFNGVNGPCGGGDIDGCPEIRCKLFGGHFHECSSHQFGYPEPVEAFVEIDAEPTTGADVGGHVKVFRLCVDVVELVPYRHPQPHCQAPVAVMIYGQSGKYSAPNDLEVR